MKLQVKFSDISEDIKVGFQDNSRDIPVKFENLQRVTEYIGGDVYWDDVLDKPFETLEDVKEAVLEDVPTKLSDLEADSISRGDQEPFDFSVYSADFNAHEMNFEVDNINFKNMNYGSGINFDGNVIHEVGSPKADTDAATKKYVDDAVKNAGGGVTSWNDLEDKPFYEEMVETEIYYGENLSVTTNYSNFIGKFSVTLPDFEFEIGATYKVYINNNLVGSYSPTHNNAIGNYGAGFGMQQNIFVLSSYNVSYYNLSMTSVCTFKLVKVTENFKHLDEKYIPDTIARKSDIPNSLDIPTKLSELENDSEFITYEYMRPSVITLDSTKRHTLGGESTYWEGDVISLINNLVGVACFKIPIDTKPAQSMLVYGTINRTYKNDKTYYCVSSSVMLDGNRCDILVAIDWEGVLVESKINVTPEIPSTDEIVESVIAALPIYNGEVEEV